ncbi:UNVERIFIED_CONTAM: hypothetical protein RMT77_007809 [Armadillidium vulgare]
MLKLVNVKINYPQKFRDEWIAIPKYSKWLRRVDGNERNCCCTCCNVILTTKLSSIEKHANTLKHKAAEALIPDDIEIPIVVKSEAPKKKRKVKSESGKKRCKVEDGTIIEQIPGPTHMLEEFCSPEEAPPSTLKFIKTSKCKKERNSNESSHKIIYSSGSNNQVSGATYLKKKSEHELDSFGRSIIAQMKMLPEEHAIELTLEIQNLVTQRRLKVISEKLAERQQQHQQQTHHTNQVPQVITVSVGNPAYTTLQPQEHFNPLEIMHPKESENHGYGASYYVSSQ